MTGVITPQSADGTIIKNQQQQALLAYGTTVPTDGDEGYETGCLFLHTDGSAGSAFYINEGTSSSADFNATETSAAGAAITDASESHAITDPADTPADADALRDDLVANGIPDVEAALDALGVKVNAIIAALETYGVIST